MTYKNINREEELKSRIGKDFFVNYDYTTIVGDIDFCVSLTYRQKNSEEKISILWAEAKRGTKDIFQMFAQLILTIGKARTFTKYLPPPFLGVFDAEKIAFVRYETIQHLFFQNDFNWNVAPSNYKTKEFNEIKLLINNIIEKEKYLYHFGKENKELHFFIKNNLKQGTDKNKIQIDKNNFVLIYQRWQEEILPHIKKNFKDTKNKIQIQERAFYLADLFIDDKNDLNTQKPIKDNLEVKFSVLKDQVIYTIETENLVKSFVENAIESREFKINKIDMQKYIDFWKRYKRPPATIFHDYIFEHQELLVPQDIRERKGAFFTPKKWRDLSLKYISEVFGENWQEEYYVWDCCAGTGNLVDGLLYKDRVFASTIDQSDVTTMKERIKMKRLNLREDHVFQFDFLNDPIDVFKETTKQNTIQTYYDPQTGKKTHVLEPQKLPEKLFQIIKNERRKLIIYMNPPYAEAGNSKLLVGTGTNKAKTSFGNRTYERYKKQIGSGINEVFAQFLIRIRIELANCKIANFSTLKNLQGSNFKQFRHIFQPELKRLFVMPANTFDNVKGQFPIGFFIWDTYYSRPFNGILADVYDKNENKLPPKYIHAHNGKKINQWIKIFDAQQKQSIGFICLGRNDFQHVKYVHIRNNPDKLVDKGGLWINQQNIIPVCIYLAVQHCIKFTWLLDRDQFLFPKDSWKNDEAFHNDCLVFTLFHNQNRISLNEGTNHWIPFSEEELGLKEKFESNFINNFLYGKIENKHIIKNNKIIEAPVEVWQIVQKRTFSEEAQAVFDAGKELWKYYHSKEYDSWPDASLYDIKDYFQKRNPKTGRMNNKSKDEKYNELLEKLKETLNCLAKKIEKKVYEHGFLLN